MKDGSFAFGARLEQASGGGPYYVTLPASVSTSIGRRGIVPVVALVNGIAEVRASIVPCGGGRHRLRLNASTRDEAGARVGERVAVELRVDEAPVADPVPADLARALRDAGALDTFARFPAGKQNHIVHWVEAAVREGSREKRIEKTVEVASAARERAVDRARSPLPHAKSTTLKRSGRAVDGRTRT